MHPRGHASDGDRLDQHARTRARLPKKKRAGGVMALGDAGLRSALAITAAAELATAAEPAERRLRTAVDSILALPAQVEFQGDVTDRRQVEELQAARSAMQQAVHVRPRMPVCAVRPCTRMVAS